MSNRHTPWAQKASSLPSDRIAPSRPVKTASKGKQSQNDAVIPKSKAVRRLEQLRDGLVALGDRAPVRDPEGGCYCQAREHELSKYTPMCLNCGLILCALNLPHYACPHCRAALLTAPARLSLTQSLDQTIANTLAQEGNERQQAMEEARRVAGAFPTLAASAVTNPSGGLDSHPVNQPHKVLSLNPKTKKVTVSTKVQRPQNTFAIKAPPAEPNEPEPRRVPRPPSEVPFSSKPLNTDRPWMNLRPGSKPVAYIPPPAEAQSKQAGSSGKRSKKNARKGDGSHQLSNENASNSKTE